MKGLFILIVIGSLGPADVGVTSAGPNDPITIDVNRPFIYVIRETSTNSILFMGRVTDPSVK